jgi:dihydroflavonol-4-reductase
MTVLVTGASGFVGAAVARELVRRGTDVRVLLRAGSNPRNLENLPVARAVGDLQDRASLDRAARGCEALFHVAADYRLWVPDAAAMYRVNVDGTRAVLEAAAQSGVKRIVYTSSVATLGTTSDGRPADETTPSTLDDMIGPYKRSKFMAEELVRGMAATGMPVVIVNPSTPIGPGDVKPTPTGSFIVDALAGRMPAYVDTGLNVVHVDDVAVGHLLAYERGAIGRRYVLGGTDMTLRDILAACARISGRSSSPVRLPHGAVLPMAYVAEALARATGRTPRVTVDGVRLSRKHMYFSSERAVQELGYRARPPAEALRDAADWFRKHGYVR